MEWLLNLLKEHLNVCTDHRPERMRSSIQSRTDLSDWVSESRKSILPPPIILAPSSDPISKTHLSLIHEIHTPSTITQDVSHWFHVSGPLRSAHGHDLCFSNTSPLRDHYRFGSLTSQDSSYGSIRDADEPWRWLQSHLLGDLHARKHQVPYWLGELNHVSWWNWAILIQRYVGIEKIWCKHCPPIQFHISSWKLMCTIKGLPGLLQVGTFGRELHHCKDVRQSSPLTLLSQYLRFSATGMH